MSSTITLSSETIKFDKLKDGVNHATSSDGKLKLSAHVTAGKVTELTATGSDGKSLAVTTLREAESTGKVTCWTCIDYGFGRICYEIDCGSLPSPKPIS